MRPMAGATRPLPHQPPTRPGPGRFRNPPGLRLSIPERDIAAAPTVPQWARGFDVVGVPVPVVTWTATRMGAFLLAQTGWREHAMVPRRVDPARLLGRAGPTLPQQVPDGSGTAQLMLHRVETRRGRA